MTKLVPKKLNKKTPYRLTPQEYLERLRQFVKDRYNGELLSDEWQGYKKVRYKFRDAFGTEFEQTAENILHKKLWTPNRGLMAEPITRQAIEHLFQHKFEKNTSLLNKKITGLDCNYLELDGYNESLKIAFEYQGFPSHWDKEHPEYEQTRKRDKFKKNLCRDLGIMLIQIPKYSSYDLRHFDDTNILQHIIKQIQKEYKKAELTLPDLNIEEFKIDFKSLNHGKEKLSLMKQMAEENNGKLISTEYKGRLYRHKFYDIDSNQEFEISWKELRQNGYPKRFLKKNINNNIQEEKIQFRNPPKVILNIVEHSKLKNLQEIAEKAGFDLLSTQWCGVEHRYVFLSNNKYYAINYQWINKFGFLDKNIIEKFHVTVNRAKTYLK